MPGGMMGQMPGGMMGMQQMGMMPNMGMGQMPGGMMGQMPGGMMGMQQMGMMPNMGMGMMPGQPPVPGVRPQAPAQAVPAAAPVGVANPTPPPIEWAIPQQKRVGYMAQFQANDKAKT